MRALLVRDNNSFDRTLSLLFLLSRTVRRFSNVSRAWFCCHFQKLPFASRPVLGPPSSRRGLLALTDWGRVAEDGAMWVDERGSDVLGLAECRQLLAIGATHHIPGHLGFQGGGSPTVVPVDYSMDGPDILIRVGEGLFGNFVGRVVAFEVEGVNGDRPWSVLVRGLAIGEEAASVSGSLPAPRVSQPGAKMVRIRTDVLTGRRLGLPGE
jgi:hypothetical protein